MYFFSMASPSAMKINLQRRAPPAEDVRCPPALEGGKLWDLALPRPPSWSAQPRLPGSLVGLGQQLRSPPPWKRLPEWGSGSGSLWPLPPDRKRCSGSTPGSAISGRGRGRPSSLGPGICSPLGGRFDSGRVPVPRGPPSEREAPPLCTVQTLANEAAPHRRHGLYRYFQN